MSQRYHQLSVAASTAYAQLHTATLGLELDRDVSHLHGSFATKQVKGRTHWYFCFRDLDARVRQIYVGPDSAEVQALVQKARSSETRTGLKALAKSAQALGCTTVARKHLSVILRLNEFGFFRAGGVLVGTHAFLAFANQLGLRWVGGEQTSDVDLAHAGRNISIALPATVVAQPHAALTSMEDGFLPMVQYRGTAGASYRHPTEPDFQIDFLTTKVSDDDAPITIAHLDVALQPLRFMEFSLQDVQQATLFDPTGRCVVVNLPAPQRYAVHKLLITGERSGAFKAKVAKDVLQAASLIEYLLATDPEALQEAWSDALTRGPGWKKRALEGLRALRLQDAALAQQLQALSPDAIE